MLTHTSLFTDIAKQLVRWFCDLPQNHTFDLTKTMRSFPRCTRYAIELNGLEQHLRLIAYDDVDYPMGYVLDDIPIRDKAKRYSEAGTTATQIARLVGEGPDHYKQSVQQLHVANSLTVMLMRQVSEDQVLRLDIHTRFTGYRLGLSATNRSGRVVVNEGFDFTTDPEDGDVTPTEVDDAMTLSGGGLFHYYHQQAKGSEHKVFFRDLSSLEAVIHQGGRLSYFPGSWPVKAFTALSGGPFNDCPGLALKTTQGWLVILHGHGEGIRPYYCFAIPDVFAKQYQVPDDRYVGEETVQLLLATHQLRHACRV